MRTRGRDGRYQISLLCRAEWGLCPTYCLFCCPQPPPYTRCWGGRRTLPFTPAYHHQQICLFSSLKKQTHTNTSMETLRGSHGERPGPRTGGSGLSHPALLPSPQDTRNRIPRARERRGPRSPRVRWRHNGPRRRGMGPSAGRPVIHGAASSWADLLSHPDSLNQLGAHGTAPFLPLQARFQESQFLAPISSRLKTSHLGI